MKIQDRVTGAFGDKLSDDSDDETGEASKGLVMGSDTVATPSQAARFATEPRTGTLAAAGSIPLSLSVCFSILAFFSRCSRFPKKDAAAAAEAKKKEAVHEDEVAVVTVVTREQNSEDDADEDDLSDDDQDDGVLGGRTGFPFLGAPGDAAAASASSATPGSASTPFVPNKTQQAQAVQRAKHALKAKDKAKSKGMSSKGGHKYKKPKIMSKKKKIKSGSRKGANRDK